MSSIELLGASQQGNARDMQRVGRESLEKRSIKNFREFVRGELGEATFVPDRLHQDACAVPIADRVGALVTTVWDDLFERLQAGDETVIDGGDSLLVHGGLYAEKKC